MPIKPLGKNHAFLLFVFLSLVFIALLLSDVREERRSVLRVSFLDVGQGDALFIETPNGNQALIDGGPSPHITRTLGSVMPRGDRSIDLVVATHADADHIGGLPQVLEEYRVTSTLEPLSSSDTAVYAAWQILEREEEAHQLVAERGQVIELDRGVYLTILYPGEGMYGLEGNDASIVARLSYGSTCFIFTGDADSRVEHELVGADSNLLDCDVLKVGHHGSRTSTSREFVEAVTPHYGVISAGEGNRYNHPHREVIDILEETDVNVLTTFIEGTITFESDGQNTVLITQ